MAEFWRSKNFKSLAEIWDEKLKEAGFLDAEIELKTERTLRQKASNCYRHASEVERDLRQQYFTQVGYFANNTDLLNGEKDLGLFAYALFPNELEKLVMVRHSEGATIREIVDEITLKGMTRDRKTIRHIIRRWQMKWGIRSWTLRQMNLKK